MEDYTVRIGTRRAKTAARDIYAIPSRTAEDDGRLHIWITDSRAHWSWNEGPCPCGGIMRWAEAGYVPWHRICERCGSHWDLHPVTIYLRPYDRVPTITGYALDDVRPIHSIIDPPTMIRRTDGSLWLAEMDASSEAETADLRQRVRALLTGDMITVDMCQHGAIYGGWARRARFF